MDRITLIKVKKNDKDELDKLRREIGLIQEEDIKNPEFMRRATKVLKMPDVKDILIKDAELKRRQKNE